MFNPVPYFEDLKNKLKLTKDKYKFSTISGISELEGILSSRKRHQFQIAVDDSENGVTMQGQGRGYFERRPYTVFLCAVGKYDDMAKREAILQELRTIYRAFLSKILLDGANDGLILFDTTRTAFYELPGSFADGVVGLYFIVTVDNQIDLTYESADWE
ncbi:MAG: hypothetical protein QM503_03835 [Bacteroidota bacterium]